MPGAPVVAFLMIDSRVIVASIEQSFGDVLRASQISGWEYLDKIVQVPFSLPDPPPYKVQRLVVATLYGARLDARNVATRLGSLCEKLVEEKEKLTRESKTGELPVGSGKNDNEDDEKGPQLLVGFGDIEERVRANTLIKRLKEPLERGDHAAAVRAFVRTLPDAASVSGGNLSSDSDEALEQCCRCAMSALRTSPKVVIVDPDAEAAKQEEFKKKVIARKLARVRQGGRSDATADNDVEAGAASDAPDAGGSFLTEIKHRPKMPLGFLEGGEYHEFTERESTAVRVERVGDRKFACLDESHDRVLSITAGRGTLVSESEMNTFEYFVAAVDPNARRLKRIVNTYALAIEVWAFSRRRPRTEPRPSRARSRGLPQTVVLLPPISRSRNTNLWTTTRQSL